MIFSLVGESGAGKSTIERRIEQLIGGQVLRVTSHTTRPMRVNEVNGVDYHFINDAEFLKLQEERKFLEHSIYRGWKYGITEESLDLDKHTYISVINPNGFAQIKEKIQDKLIGIYINVPERERMIRLLKRGDNIDEIIRRVTSDRVLFKDFKIQADYIVDNNNIYQATQEVVSIILNQRNK